MGTDGGGVGMAAERGIDDAKADVDGDGGDGGADDSST